MNSVTDIDIQIKSILFVVDRPRNPTWSFSVDEKREHFVLAYAQSGAAFYTIGGEKIHVKKGNVVFMKPHQAYCAKSDDENPWSFFSVAFVAEFGDDESKKFFLSLPSIFRFSDSSRTLSNFAELHRVWTAKRTGCLIKCRSLILDIFHILLSDEIRRGKASAHYGKIESIVDMMRENSEKNFSLSELCEISGLSSSHFRMLFKEITGLSSVQFQNRLKIDCAKDLILSGSCNVTEAARAVGFDNVYYFSRLFRKLTGKNPSEYLNT